jgi:predicted kinase
MNYYRAYGLTIESEFDLPELPTTTDRSAEVSFRRGDVDPVPKSDGQKESFRSTASENVARLTYDPVGSFLVEAGTRVTFDPTTNEVVERVITRRLFENQMMGLVLHQRGHLVLHASAVAVDGKAIVFLGQRGAGKSTMAAAFHQAGYEVFEDDTLGVRFEDGVPTVVPGVPRLRLRPQTAETLGIDSVTGSTFGSDSEKVHVSLSDVPDPAPLAQCYRLKRGEPFAFEELSLSDKFFNLLSRTFVRGLLRDTDAAGDHFEQCADVITAAPFQTLRYPETIADLPSVVESLVEDLRAGS